MKLANSVPGGKDNDLSILELVRFQGTDQKYESSLFLTLKAYLCSFAALCRPVSLPLPPEINISTLLLPSSGSPNRVPEIRPKRNVSGSTASKCY